MKHNILRQCSCFLLRKPEKSGNLCSMSLNLKHRPRRNRRTGAIREMVAETHLTAENLVFPLFLTGGKDKAEAISTLPGLHRYSVDRVLVQMQKWVDLGLRSYALFPQIEEKLKDKKGSESLNPKGLFAEAIFQIKKKYPDVVLFTDVALDPYSSDGHDGVVENGQILNDETVEILAKMSVVQAQAGADYVSPSDMMDGRVGAIRQALDKNGFQDVGIMAYSAKYASSFYGPFRDALGSAPKSGDKKTYQMDYRNRLEALREVQLDVQQGADIVMVKPALSYLDVIREVKNSVKIPVAAYNVSGEYAMIKFAAQAGAMDPHRAMMEVLTSIKRAGADLIFTYFAEEFLTS